MLIEIKSRHTGAVLYATDVPDDTPRRGSAARVALEKAATAGASLAGANLAGANLADAHLAGAKWRADVVIRQRPIRLSGLLWDVSILDAHMQIGCELHSLAQWAEYDDERIVQMDRQALRFWREHKDGLLALARVAGRSFEAVAAPADATGSQP